MISKRMERSTIAEDAFEKELEALHKGIRRIRGLDGTYVEEREGLLQVALNYIDELNKVRKYACPLSTNMLLSSISESLLLVLVLRHSTAAKRTKIWIKAEGEQRKGTRISPEVPSLHFAELIQISAELKLFRTSGIQSKITSMLIERSAFYKDLSTTDPSMAEAWVASIRTSTWDAKRTHQMIHQIRETRNAVHPTQIMTSNAKQSADQFVMTIWRGLRLLALLNEMLSIRSSLTDY